MVFEIKNKVAIVTGGASGIGLNYVKELLKNGVKGVTMADVNQTFGETSLDEIEREFGSNKVIFVQTDTSDKKQFEKVFVETINKFGNVDILINNAGISNDSIWEKEIAVNLNGTINGILLGLDKYLPKHKQGDEAVIVNMSSIVGVEAYSAVPVYVATKHAVLGLTKSFGTPDHYEATKVRVVAICPGGTNTPMANNISGRNLGERYEKIVQETIDSWPMQEPEFVAKEAMRIIQYAKNGTMWIVEAEEPSYQYIFAERSAMKKNTLQS